MKDLALMILVIFAIKIIIGWIFLPSTIDEIKEEQTSINKKLDEIIRILKEK